METTDRPPDMDLRALDGVYRRVTRTDAPPETPDSGDTLRALIEEAAFNGEMYGLLARKTGGTPHGAALRQMAREERELERKLQADLLILTGDTCPIPPARPGAPYLLRALAGQARRELARSRIPLPPLPELPALSLRHAEKLREIIADIIR